MKKQVTSSKQISSEEAQKQLEGLHELNQEFIDNMSCVFNLRI